jgi:hypothetical protein
MVNWKLLALQTVYDSVPPASQPLFFGRFFRAHWLENGLFPGTGSLVALDNSRRAFATTELGSAERLLRIVLARESRGDLAIARAENAKSRAPRPAFALDSN